MIVVGNLGLHTPISQSDIDETYILVILIHMTFRTPLNSTVGQS